MPADDLSRGEIPHPIEHRPAETVHPVRKPLPRRQRARVVARRDHPRAVGAKAIRDPGQLANRGAGGRQPHRSWDDRVQPERRRLAHCSPHLLSLVVPSRGLHYVSAAGCSPGQRTCLPRAHPSHQREARRSGAQGSAQAHASGDADRVRRAHSPLVLVPLRRIRRVSRRPRATVRSRPRGLRTRARHRLRQARHQHRLPDLPRDRQHRAADPWLLEGLGQLLLNASAHGPPPAWRPRRLPAAPWRGRPRPRGCRGRWRRRTAARRATPAPPS